MKRFIVILLSLVILSAVFCGCNETAEKATTVSTVEKSEESTTDLTSSKDGKLTEESEIEDKKTTVKTEPVLSNPKDTSSVTSKVSKPIEEKLPPSNNITNNTKKFSAEIIEVYEDYMLVKPSGWDVDKIPAESIIVPFEYAKGEKLKLKKFRGSFTIYYEGEIIGTNSAKLEKIVRIYEYGSQSSSNINGYEVATLETGYPGSEETTKTIEPFCKDEKGNSIYLIKSVDELKKYSNVEGPVEDLPDGYKLLKYYDEEFFKNYALAIRTLVFGSGSISCAVTDVTLKNGTLEYTIEVYRPEMGTCDMAGWSAMVEIPKSQLEKITYINTKSIGVKR